AGQAVPGAGPAGTSGAKMSAVRGAAIVEPGLAGPTGTEFVFAHGALCHEAKALAIYPRIKSNYPRIKSKRSHGSHRNPRRGLAASREALPVVRPHKSGPATPRGRFRCVGSFPRAPCRKFRLQQ